MADYSGFTKSRPEETSSLADFDSFIQCTISTWDAHICGATEANINKKPDTVLKVLRRSPVICLRESARDGASRNYTTNNPEKSRPRKPSRFLWRQWWTAPQKQQASPERSEKRAFALLQTIRGTIESPTSFALGVEPISINACLSQVFDMPSY